MKLIGYSDRLSVAPGETISFMVSSTHQSYRADIVRLRHGLADPRGPGFKEDVVAAIGAGYPGRVQPIVTGSYVAIDNAAPLRLSGSFTLHAWICPTRPGNGAQGILGMWSERDASGYALVLDEDATLVLWLGDGAGATDRVRAAAGLRLGTWYSVAAVFDVASGRVTLRQEPVVVWPLDGSRAETNRGTRVRSLGGPDVPFLIAGRLDDGDQVVGCFNGKIDRPSLFGRALAPDELIALERGRSPLSFGATVVAAWDFGQEISSARIVDTSPNGLHGRAVNLPTRGVTGHNWTGRTIDFADAPDEYGAIHFHDDDLEDAGWEVDFTWTVPADEPSGIYAARLRAGGDEDHLPFVVRPQPGSATAPVAYLIPTFTYLAYANEQLAAEPPALFPFYDPHLDEAAYDYVAAQRLLSCYDSHADGSGVCYSSWKRPLLNVRPKALFRVLASPERLPADLFLIDWLDEKGHRYDVIADENLHAEGVDLLRRYRVVVTGTHPEYWTGPMLDALGAYLADGGRLMYLGGNGFYWVTGVDPERPHVVEIRRWHGTESWAAAPGEYYLSTTGELGGLWRHRNRAPQKLVGVGFTAQGNDFSRPYVRQPDSFDPRAAFIFDGIGDDELIGDFPSLMLRHGAAGYEIDRADPALGTPPHALLLATASGFSDSYQHVIEEILSTDNVQGGTSNPLVRADLVYFETPNGGAVFSTGSIAWCGCLSSNGYHNNVSRITDNVLRRFAADEPLP